MQDPDISEEDKAQAMQELQGMFNTAGKRGGKGDKISKQDLLEGAGGMIAKGATTTGSARSRASRGDDESAPLLPRPRLQK